MASAGHQEWQARAALTQPRLGACAVATDRLLYLIGGLDTRGRALDTVELYSNQTNQWYEGPALPVARYCGAAGIQDGHLWVLGGFTGVDRIPTATVFRWDERIKKWESGAELPEGRGGHIAGLASGCFYCAGGKTVSGMSYDFIRCRPNLTQWEELQGVQEWDHAEAMPEACELACGGFVGNMFVVVGGRNGPRGLDTVRLYSDSIGWRYGTSMPEARWDAACAIFSSFLILAGGMNNEHVFTCVDAYNPLTDQWVSLPSLPRPIHGAAAAVIGTTLYIVGGGQQPSLSFTDEVVALDLAKTVLVDTEQFGPAKENVRAYTGAQLSGRRTMPY